jgi:hypothetical protein
MEKHFAIGVTILTTSFVFIGFSGDGYVHKLALILGGVLAGLLAADLLSEKIGK